VNQKAFGQPQEGQLVDALRTNGGVLLSLVATLNGHVVGHILYSPLSVSSDGGKVVEAGLGPMAVLPEYQRRGIGGKLIETANQKLREVGCPFIVVLGHPEYYPRFGFKPASGYGIRCEWNVPDNVFMVLVMDQLKMKGVSRLAKYRQEFFSVV
jgi:putative acetyltransferase